MRTTVSIDDELLAAAKRQARNRNETLGQVIESALRRELSGSQEDLGPAPRIPVFTGGSGPRPGIDLTSNRALHEALDDDIELDRRR